LRADICEPQDTDALANFRRVLHSLGAEFVRDFGSPHDVQVVELHIGGELLRVFSDSSSVDIEGPPELVQRVTAGMAEGKPSNEARKQRFSVGEGPES